MKIEEYLDRFEKEVENGYLGMVPTINGEEINDISVPYLSLYAGNRNLSGNFLTVDLIKKKEKKVRANTATLEVPSNIGINNKLVVFKEDILEIDPFFNFGKEYKAKDLNEIISLILKNQITVFSINSFDPGKVADDIVLLPIKNITNQVIEIIPTDFIMEDNLHLQKQKPIEWSINLEKIKSNDILGSIQYIKELIDSYVNNISQMRKIK